MEATSLPVIEWLGRVCEHEVFKRVGLYCSQYTARAALHRTGERGGGGGGGNYTCMYHLFKKDG